MFHPKGPTFCELMKQAFSSTKEGYDQLAPKFDYTPFLTDGRLLRAAVWQLRHVRRYFSAIDLCTGTGAGMEALLPIVEKRITGVDWSVPMLTEATKKLDEAMSDPDGPILSFVEADIFDLPYRDSFDLATCFGALGHIERKRRKEFISIVHAMLRTGGVFAFITSETPKWWTRLFWIWLGFDWVMRIRNLIIRPKFIMYYLNFLIPEVLPLFDEARWSSVHMLPIDINGKPTMARLVIATKK